MLTNETYTAIEIMDILQELDVEVSFESSEENEFNLANIDCALGPLDFSCLLVINEPFFEGIKLYSHRFNVDNPFRFANEFNDAFRTARASVELDSDGLIVIDEDGDTTVRANADIYFAGGVTKEHVRFMFEMWIEDLVDFHEISFEDVEEEVREIPALQTLENATLQDQIFACLTGGYSMTAREIAQILDKDRHIVNSVLYKERKRFKNDGSQPPRWSLI